MNFAYFVVTWGVLVLALPALAFADLPEIGAVGPEALVCWVVLLYSATRLASLAAAGRPKLLSITFFAFIYVWVGLAATAQVMVREFPYPVIHQPDDVLAAVMEVVLGIAAYEFGQLWYIRSRRAGRHPETALQERPMLAISDTAAIVLAVAAIPLTLAGMYLWGFGNLFLTRGAASDLFLASGSKMGNLLTLSILHAPPMIALVVIAYQGLTRWRMLSKVLKQTYFILGTTLLLLNVAANYPPQQTRFWLGAVILTPAFALPRWRRWLAPMWILALTTGLTVVYPYLDMFRRAMSVEEGVQTLQSETGITSKLLYKGDYDVFQLTVNGYVYANTGGDIRWGANLLGAALFWVPRSLWPSKPEGTGYIVGKYSRYLNTNLSTPLWMEAYMAFGWLGIAILLSLYGRLCAWAETIYAASLDPSRQASVARLVVPSWAAFHTFVMRGDLQNAVAYPSFGFLLLFGTALLPRFFPHRFGVPPMLPRPGVTNAQQPAVRRSHPFDSAKTSP